MVFVTGDCHADFQRFVGRNFPGQSSMHRSDTMIICGDFGGVWYDSADERGWLDWLSSRKYTTCFVDGNHENFDRLLGGEFPVVDFHGSKAKKIRNGVYYLMRGHVYDFEGKKVFCMGGASSHDIADGILDPGNFASIKSFYKMYNRWVNEGRQFRINHLSWWKQELPDEAEMEAAERELERHDFKVDYVITHCLPTSIAASISNGFYKPDSLTDFFDHLLQRNLQFREWHCGHYHRRLRTPLGYYVHYEDIMRLI